MISDSAPSGSSDLDHVSEPTLEVELNVSSHDTTQELKSCPYVRQWKSTYGLGIPIYSVKRGNDHDADPQFHGPQIFTNCIRSWIMSLLFLLFRK